MWLKRPPNGHLKERPLNKLERKSV